MFMNTLNKFDLKTFKQFYISIIKIKRTIVIFFNIYCLGCIIIKIKLLYVLKNV